MLTYNITHANDDSLKCRLAQETQYTDKYLAPKVTRFLVLLWCRWLRGVFLNQVIRNRLCLSEQTYPGLLESGPDPRYVIRLQIP